MARKPKISSPEDQVPLARDNPYFSGHNEAERTFLDAWTSGRLAHAWLICGPRGIGKATLAYRMARFALSQPNDADQGGGLFGDPTPESDTLQMSGEHPVFRRVSAQGHGDFRAIERAWADTKQSKRKASISVSEVRGIGSFLRLTPAEGGWRVVVIDAADEMNHNAENAVLKVLEEPPQKALIFLVSHNPARLLPTVRSRCRRLDLSPLPTQTVSTLLTRYRPDFSSSETGPLSVLADGSIGRAIELANSGGLDLFRNLIGVLATLPKMDITMAHALSDKTFKGEGFRTVADLLTWWLARMVTVTAKDGWSQVQEIVPGEHAIADRLCASAGLDQWVEVWEKIARLFERADAVHLDRKHTVLNALLAIEKRAAG
ncbi:MAG: DNA polymerase III subunit delta' [Rhodospirillaceae bacterium]|nr:DNA polymerase III subunit delta' [Rhodospirillaceae bacterium]